MSKTIDKDPDLISMSKKLLSLWDKEYLLAIMATPFTVSFLNWMFRQDIHSYEALKYFAVVVAVVSFGSVFKHIAGAWLGGYYKNKLTILENDNRRISERAEDDKFRRETERAEKHFQMKQLKHTSSVTLEIANGIHNELNSYFKDNMVGDHALIQSVLNMGKTARDSLYKLSSSIELPYQKFTEIYYNIDKEVRIDEMPEPNVEESTVGEHSIENSTVDLNPTSEELDADTANIHNINTTE
jgi:hypothetical protein